MTELRAQNIGVRRGDATLVNAASFTLSAGRLTVLLGANGAGKTTLLRAALGLIPHSGTCDIDSQPISKMPPAARARLISYLPQRRPLAWPNSVRDIVALGRFAHGAAIGRLSETDARAVDDAITDCALELLADRRADTLSGGETARMHCARAFAANAPILIADEPVAALDPRHQFRVMELIRNYVDRGHSALVVLHDLSLAARYADDLIWMKDGAIHAQGPVEDTLSARMISAIYGVSADVDDRRVTVLGPQD